MKGGYPMNQNALSFSIEEDCFSLEVFLDPFNNRMRIDDCRGNTNMLIEKAEELAKQYNVEKLIIKVRTEQFLPFFENGFQPEAMIDHYFLGSDAYFFSKYYTVERKNNDQWIAGDMILKRIRELKNSFNLKQPPKVYLLKKVDEIRADELSKLYLKVFPIYPTPLHDPEYVKKTMTDGSIYYAFFHQDTIVSAASAELNFFYKNAEITDCATLMEHRKFGLMKWILLKLEEELKKKGVYCSYSIARSLSYGMNAALYQLGYQYRGRLLNNCYIYDKLENMNMWVKDLSGCINFGLK